MPAFGGGYERKYMSEQKKTSIGGQALLEGIMMRGPKVTAIAVRDPEGRMVLEKYPTKGNDRPKFCRLPFIRGIFNLYDSLVFGYKCLMRSAEIAGLEEEDELKKGKAPVQEADKQAGADAEAESQAPETGEIGAEETSQAGSAGAQPAAAESAEDADGREETTRAQETACAQKAAAKNDAKDKWGKEKAQSAAMMIFSVVLGLLLAIGLFIYLPSLITKWLSGAVPAFENQVLRSVAEGVIRIIIFIGYMASMLLMKDIRRTYMYHGAEHKTIFCYENERAKKLGEVLTGSDPDTISVVVGSEGGFSPEEARFAGECGLTVTGLGTRILRCETAPVFVLSCISFVRELC